MERVCAGLRYIGQEEGGPFSQAVSLSREYVVAWVDFIVELARSRRTLPRLRKKHSIAGGSGAALTVPRGAGRHKAALAGPLLAAGDSTYYCCWKAGNSVDRPL